RFTVLKPGNVNVISYVPGRKASMRKLPDPSVTLLRVFSMSAALDASTVTPGSTAPDVSLTVPAIALVCAETTAGSSARQTAPRTMRAKLRIPIPPDQNAVGTVLGK